MNQSTQSLVPVTKIKFSIYEVLASLILFLSVLRGSRASEQWEIQAVIFVLPLDFLKTYSLQLIAILLLFLIFYQINSICRRGVVLNVSLSSLFIITFNLIVFVRAYALDLSSGGEMLISVIAMLALFFVFGVVGNMPLDSICDRCLLIVFSSYSLFVISSLVELLVNGAGNVYWSGRFYGVANHAVYCGALSSFGVISGLHFVLSGRVAGFIKLIIWIFIGVGFAFIVASGTRTGLIITAVATLVLIRNQGAYYKAYFVVGGAIVLAVCAGFLAFYFLNINDINEDARILSLSNTRADSWSYLWESFLENPIYGSPDVGAESSVLMALARGGVLFSGIFFIGFIIFMRAVVNVYGMAKIQRGLSGVSAISFGLLVLAIFEGYLHDRLSYFNVVFFLVAGVVESVRAQCRKFRIN